MNFFETTLSNVTFSLAGVQYETELSESGRVTIGVRPEAIQIGVGVTGRVSWVETLGANFLVGVRMDDAILAALLPNRPVAAMIEPALDRTERHVFDIASGPNLRLRRSECPADRQP